MTPPPPASVASMMTPGTEAEDSSINRDLLSVMDRPTLRYWRTRPPEERIAAVEFLRQQTYGARARLRRVYRLVDCPWG